ncbi:MAG: substrate-binding domain-containing protein [Burkholderiales bacterium]|nr:MAG: substrate-binding domain-containing protein [Burkholderiales bacterium]
MTARQRGPSGPSEDALKAQARSQADGAELPAEPRGGRRVTILDVARDAGVSVGTVSRVINKNQTVRPELRERVLGAARALGYEPDVVAQSLRSQATRAVGCMVSEVSNPLFAAIVAAAEQVLRQSAYTMILANSHDRADYERDILTLFRRRRLEGVLLTISDEQDPRVVEILSSFNLPVVLIERECPLPVDAATANHYDGALQAVNYLLMLQHRRIGLITVPRTALPGRQRGRAFEDAYRAAGLEPDPELMAFDGFSSDYGYQTAYRMLISPHPPTAIIAGANQMVGVLKAVRMLNVEVPGRLSLITIGDTDLASLYSPPITAVRWEARKVGEAAAQLLIARLSGEAVDQPAQRIVLPTELVLRQSCARPRQS